MTEEGDFYWEEREEKAQTLEEQGRLPEALELFAQMADEGEAEGDWNLFLTGAQNLVRFHLDQGELEPAQESSLRLRRFVSQNEPEGPATLAAPGSGLNYLWQAHAREAKAKGDLALAKTAYEWAISFDDDSDSLCELSDVLVELGDEGEARALLERALAVCEARYPHKAGKPERKLRALAPPPEKSWSERVLEEALACEHAGDLQRALEAFTALGGSGKEPGEDRLRRQLEAREGSARVAAALGQSEQAEATRTRLLMALGASLGEVDETEAVRDRCERLLRLAPLVDPDMVRFVVAQATTVAQEHDETLAERLRALL